MNTQQPATWSYTLDDQAVGQLYRNGSQVMCRIT
jgi:hypothetical protein